MKRGANEQAIAGVLGFYSPTGKARDCRATGRLAMASIGRSYEITARRGGKGADQRDIRLPGQSCLAYDPPRLHHAPLPRDRENVSGSLQASSR